MLCRAREKGERFTACLSCESLEAMILPQIEEIGHNFRRIRFSASTDRRAEPLAGDPRATAVALFRPRRDGRQA
jgi:hypothetical protein